MLISWGSKYFSKFVEYYNLTQVIWRPINTLKMGVGLWIYHGMKRQIQQQWRSLLIVQEFLIIRPQVLGI